MEACKAVGFAKDNFEKEEGGGEEE